MSRQAIPTISDYQQMLAALQQDGAGFLMLAEVLKRECGIHLADNPKNRSLMAGRLGPIFKEKGITTYAEYFKLLSAGREEAAEFVSALTTNTTSFFREPAHFEVLKEVFRTVRARKLAQGSREMRIWCAACSTGQEAYSILMTLLESCEERLCWDFKMLATDVDREVLLRAATGLYSESESNSVPPHLREKYFLSRVGATKGGSGERQFTVRPELKKLVRFAPFNLMMEPFPFQHSFDVIFCRNVLIYFEKETAEAVTARLSRALSSEGCLFLGHSETGLLRSPDMKMISHAVYRRSGK